MLIYKAKSNVSSVCPSPQRDKRDKKKYKIQKTFLSNEGSTLESLDFAFYIGSSTTFLYFDNN